MLDIDFARKSLCGQLRGDKELACMDAVACGGIIKTTLLFCYLYSLHNMHELDMFISSIRSNAKWEQRPMYICGAVVN